MHLCYFDESKNTSPDSAWFCLGGVMIPDRKASDIEKMLGDLAEEFFGSRILTRENEFHGVEIMQGKGNCKGKPFKDRIEILTKMINIVIQHEIPVVMIKINVEKHEARYKNPWPPYKWGLVLLLERFHEQLEKENDIGIVFGDYDAKEVAQAVEDFSEYKRKGSTPFFLGRPLGRLLDTIYFTHSHHSRFLQLADILVYLIRRYSDGERYKKKNEQPVVKALKHLVESNHYHRKTWP